MDALLARVPRPKVVAVDIPIGLPDAGPRCCDREARRRLGSRRSSVFPAPIRPAVRAGSREEASRITAARDGRRVAAQAWGIYAKVRDVDEALRSRKSLRRAIREVHPEVSFWAWNERMPMQWPKRTPQGLAERVRLVEGWLGRGVLASARGEHLKKDLADDDIVDAIAALWTAHRIADGSAETLPRRPPRDSAGLRMEIVF